jgi:hypothetical protein
MDPHHLAPPQAATFLKHLEREEELLRAALVNVSELHAALLQGDLAGAQAVSERQGAHAAALVAAAVDRTASANALAGALGLPADGLTLAALATKLPEPLAAQVLTARAKLLTVTTELAAFQTRNANLLGHLRSFFRGVLSDLTGFDAPLRYGPSGSRLQPATGVAIQVRG